MDAMRLPQPILPPAFCTPCSRYTELTGLMNILDFGSHHSLSGFVLFPTEVC